MANTEQKSIGSAYGQDSTADAQIGLAKFELSQLERRQARWALARGMHSIRSVSNWGPGLVGAVIYIAGTWIVNAYVDGSNTVTLYLAYVVCALTGLVFSLGWTVRTLNRRLDAVTEIMEQQK